MINNEIELTSLCYISEDYDGKVWLYRLADVENERLQVPLGFGRYIYRKPVQYTELLK